MRKIMMIIIMLFVFIETKSQTYIPDFNFQIIQNDSVTHKIDEEILKYAKTILKEYVEITKHDFQYDTLIFDYPFKINIYNKDSLIGFIWSVTTNRIGVITKTNEVKNRSIALDTKYCYINGKKITDVSYMIFKDLLLEPVNENYEGYFGKTLIERGDLEIMVEHGSYNKHAIDQILGTYNNTNKTKRYWEQRNVVK